MLDIDIIEANIPKVVEIEETNIMKIMITTSTNVSNVSLKVQQLIKRPIEVIEMQDTIYQYFNITTGIKSEDICNIAIEFKVNTSWIDENNIILGSISLNRFNATTKIWDILPTEQIGETNGYIIFSSKTPHFSIFTITGSVEDPMELPIDPSEPEPEMEFEPEPEPEPEVPGFGIVATILALLGAVLLFKENKK